MLKVYLGDYYIFMPGKISDTKGYFDYNYERSWFQSDMAKRIIREVDKSEYISGEYIESPVFGGIPPTRLSTGCRTLLILLNEPDKIVSGDRMGDNCYPLLFDMAKGNDYTITLCHYLSDVKYEEPWNMMVADTGSVINNKIDLIKEIITCCDGDRKPEWYKDEY